MSVGPCVRSHERLIDPGLSGAVAALAPDGTREALSDTPTLTLKTTRGMKQEYDIPGLVRLLAPSTGLQAHRIIEEAQAMPGQGTRSMFTIGLGMGVWLGILATLGLAHTRGRPGRMLRAARTREALSQIQAAQLTGIPQRHISEMEHGKRAIGKERAKKLAEGLKIDYHVFL